MAIEPYRRRAAAFEEGAFSDDRVWGAPNQSPAAPRRRRVNIARLWSQRRKTDPNWPLYPQDVRKAIIARDIEAHR